MILINDYIYFCISKNFQHQHYLEKNIYYNKNVYSPFIQILTNLTKLKKMESFIKSVKESCCCYQKPVLRYKNEQLVNLTQKPSINLAALKKNIRFGSVNTIQENINMKKSNEHSAYQKQQNQAQDNMLNKRLKRQILQRFCQPISKFYQNPVINKSSQVINKSHEKKKKLQLTFSKVNEVILEPKSSQNNVTKSHLQKYQIRPHLYSNHMFQSNNSSTNPSSTRSKHISTPIAHKNNERRLTFSFIVDSIDSKNNITPYSLDKENNQNLINQNQPQQKNITKQNNLINDSKFHQKNKNHKENNVFNYTFLNQNKIQFPFQVTQPQTPNHRQINFTFKDKNLQRNSPFKEEKIDFLQFSNLSEEISLLKVQKRALQSKQVQLRKLLKEQTQYFDKQYLKLIQKKIKCQKQAKERQKELEVLRDNVIGYEKEILKKTSYYEKILS